MSYLLFCIAVFALCCRCSKLNNEDVTVGLALLFLFLSVFPIVNVGVAVLTLIDMVNKTEFWNKKLF